MNPILSVQCQEIQSLRESNHDLKEQVQGYMDDCRQFIKKELKLLKKQGAYEACLAQIEKEFTPLPNSQLKTNIVFYLNTLRTTLNYVDKNVT